MSYNNFSYNRVRIDEFPGVVKGVLEVVEKHNPSALKIEGMYSRLLEKRPLLNLISNKVKSEYSEPILELRKQRDQLISAILLQMRAAGKSSVPAITAAWKAISPIVKGCLENVLIRNEKVKTEKVNAFLETYFTGTELAESGNILGIHLNIVKMKELCDAIVESETARREAKATRRQADPVSLRKEIAGDLSNLIRAIELAEVENETIDYGLLKAELTELLLPFTTLVRARTTRAKNSEADNKTTATDMSSQTITAAM
ncbi:MAG: hypothetical protein H6Q19_2165 [Bacteroidetes bacterium]|nr:hypothetical protein [Bacteroidota bacterium]